MTDSIEDAGERVFIEDFDTWAMTGYHLYTKLWRSGVSAHIGTWGRPKVPGTDLESPRLRTSSRSWIWSSCPGRAILKHQRSSNPHSSEHGGRSSAGAMERSMMWIKQLSFHGSAARRRSTQTLEAPSCVFIKPMSLTSVGSLMHKVFATGTPTVIRELFRSTKQPQSRSLSLPMWSSTRGGSVKARRRG